MPYPIPADFATTGLFCAALGRKVARFQVIGERSSGTNFVKRILGRNLPLAATEALGWKHGHAQMLQVPSDLVVVIAVRRADDWARSMFAKPWHSRPGMQRLAFPEFIRAPWDTIIDRPRYFDMHLAGPEPGQPLQQDRDPVTGRRYPNLFALRGGKLASHLGFLNRDCNVCLLRMEAAIADPQGLLMAFRAAFGLPAPDTALRPVLKRLGARFQPAVAARPPLPEILSADDLAFLRAECDQELEARLGYRYPASAA